MDDYKHLNEDQLRETIRALPRAARDEQLRQFGAHYANLCQRLEAFYAPDRLQQFIAIRPGGLDEIDKAIELAKGNPKELSLLNPFRELNRILMPFMDIYEEQVLNDLTYMSQEELESILGSVTQQLEKAEKTLEEKKEDYRAEQNSSGTLRLMTLMKAAAQKELQERFGR